MFDAAGRLLLFAVEADREISRREVPLSEAEAPERARMVADLGVDVLICGAVSQVLEGMLTRHGITVIPHVCGDVEEILRCYLAGEAPQDRFGMPGCCRRRRQRGGRGGGRCRGRGINPR